MKIKIFILFITLIFLPAICFSWPTTQQWIPIYKNGMLLSDPINDAQGSRNVVSDPTHGAAYMFNDGAYVYFRMRLDQDPTGSGGQGYLKPYGWGVEFDTDLNLGNYEILLILDGIAKVETVSLWRNTIQRTLGDPSDVSEVLLSSVTVPSNFQVNTADTSINGDQDYFLDWRFSYSTIKQAAGLTDTSPLRLFFGSSSSANNLTESGADLVGASDLYTGFSDVVTSFGTRPTTGVVRFVADINGNGDVTAIDTKNTIYVRVDDADQNYDPLSLQRVSVTLTTPGGDQEVITLTETGNNTGIFTGSIMSTTASFVKGNNTIEVIAPEEVVTVLYIDGIDADIKINQQRTDTLSVRSPLITASKVVDKAHMTSGGTVTYTITIINSGSADGMLATLTDVLPSQFSYVTGSTSGFTTGNPGINGQVLKWTGSWIVPKKNAGVNGSITLSFKAMASSVAGAYYNNITLTGSNFTIVTTGDIAPVAIGAPLLNIQKEVNKTQAGPGEELIYTIRYSNLGTDSAYNLIIIDTVPSNTSYVTGSLKMGVAGSPYSTAVQKTDASNDDEGEISGDMIIFKIGVVSLNDGQVNSGPDEGAVFFKVKVR